MEATKIKIMLNCLGVLFLIAFLAGMVLLAVFVAPEFCSMLHPQTKTNSQPSILIQNNVPQLPGGWMHFKPENRVTQTFKPRLHALSGVAVGIVTINRGRGGDTITLKVNRKGTTLASVSQIVPEGFNGFLLFNLPSPVRVEPNEVLDITLSDTGKIVFGWKLGSGTYKDGAGFNGGQKFMDFIFLTCGSL